LNDGNKHYTKSKSVLSRYMSSKNDKNSIDFDDIVPIKHGGGVVTSNVNGSNKNSRQGFYDMQS
jgi:hypothetical protein